MFDAILAFGLLRETLLAFASNVHSAEIEIFAIEMELIPGTNDSFDPALLSEFLKAVRGVSNVRELYVKVASFLTEELESLRHVGAVRPLIDGFEKAGNGRPLDVPLPDRWLNQETEWRFDRGPSTTE